MIAKKPGPATAMRASGARRCCSTQDQPFDRPWDISTIVHGHNGYLDIAVLMGIPALCVAVSPSSSRRCATTCAIPLRKENIYLGDFFMMVVLFTALNAFLESFFFHRADPVWLFFVLGVLGLRQVAAFADRGAACRARPPSASPSAASSLLRASFAEVLQ